MVVCSEEFGDEWDDGVAVQFSVLSSQCSVLFSVLSTQFSGLRAQYSVLRAQYSVLGRAQYSVLRAQYSVLSSRRNQRPHFWQNRPEVGHRAGFRTPVLFACLP